MHTIAFIQVHGLHALQQQLGINILENEQLYCLHYTDNSPMYHPVVQECRGLILEKETLDIVFRCMQRFYNYGEHHTTSFDYQRAEYVEKVDGSLIKLFHHRGAWHIGTKKTLAADMTNSFGSSFKDLVFRALGVHDDAAFQQRASQYLNSAVSYHFELTSAETRVITHYTGYTLTYIHAVHTQTGGYVDEKHCASAFGASLLQPLQFASVTAAIEHVAALLGLQEGLVAYIDHIPVCKIKNPAYVEAALLGDNQLTLHKIKDLIYSQEHEEYLAYFAYDRYLFSPYVEAYQQLLEQLSRVWAELQHLTDRKAFAMASKHYVFSPVLFWLYQNPAQSPLQALEQQKRHIKHDLLDRMLT